MEEICQENGFGTESYTLVTPDDYVLSLYRIPGTFSEMQQGVKKPAVLMMHAQDCDMMEWVWNDSERANAFILARAGYDVWMGNNRGNKYSSAHLSLSPRDKAYWDYYQEDMGLKDLPTFIDFILETTGLETISYVGHSEGTTQMFLGASLNPEYFSSRINLFVALAPVASTAHIANKYIVDAAKHVRLLELALVDGLHFYNWFAPMPLADSAIDVVCDLVPDLCKAVAKHILNKGGVDNAARFDVFMSNEPSGQSYRTFVYYAQMINNGGFTLYDYGAIKNEKIYGQKTAPAVPIQNYNVPTVLLSGDEDGLATPEDVAWLSSALGDKVVF